MQCVPLTREAHGLGAQLALHCQVTRRRAESIHARATQKKVQATCKLTSLLCSFLFFHEAIQALYLATQL